MSTLERALAIAAQAHAGQRKRDAEPFILHIVRVLARVETPTAQIVAALHDILEKTDWTLEALAEKGFPTEVLAAVDALTKREGESYESLIARAASTPVAREVKLADLADNIETAQRLPDSKEREAALRKYRRAVDALRASRSVTPPPLK